MVVLFTNNSTIVIPAQFTIEPFYELVLNTSDSAVEKATQIAQTSPYESIVEENSLNQESTIVFYENQTMLMSNILKIKLNYDGSEGLDDSTKQTEIDNANTKYINALSYISTTQNNQITVQNNTSAGTASLIARSFSSNAYSSIQVSYNRINTRYIVYVFVCSNADIWTDNGTELVVDGNFGLIANGQEINGSTITPAISEESLTDANAVNYQTVIQLKNSDNSSNDGMFVLTGLDGNNVDLTFAVTNQEGYNLSTINQNTGRISFAESAKDVLIALRITVTNMYYLERVVDNEEVTYVRKNLVWNYYFKLKATQTIEVNYPFENDADVFRAYYEDEIASSTIGVSGYIRLKPYDVLNVGDRESANCLLIATNNINNTDIWSQLSFNVQYYNSNNDVWEDTNIYSLENSNNPGQYLRSITIPGNVSSNYEFTRIHVTSARSGVDAYINVRITQEVDSAPTLSYPTNSLTFAQDNKQYELREKTSLDSGDAITLTEYDTSVGLTRINVSANASKVYYEARAYNINDELLEGVTLNIENGVLTVQTDLTDAIKIKIFMRSDYGYFTLANENITYNIYYGNRVEIQPNYNHPLIAEDVETGDKYINCQVDDTAGASNRLYVSTLFNVVALDGSIVSLTSSNYSILDGHALVGGEGNPTLVYTVDSNGLFIDYSNASLPAGGYSITVQLNIDGTDSKEIEVRIFPSVATISDNSAEDPEIVACGGNIVLDKSRITFSGLDGVELYYYLGSNASPLTGDSWNIPAPSDIYVSDSLTEYVINIKNGAGITVRKVTLYAKVMPVYKLEACDGANAVTTSQGDKYASIPSGIKYNVASDASAMYFKFSETSNGQDYSLLSGNDLDLYTLSFELLNLNGEKIKDLTLNGTNTIIDGEFIYGTLNGKVIDFAMTAEDVLIRVTATLNAYFTYCANHEVQTEYGYAKQSIIIKLNKNIDSSRISVTSNNGQANLVTNPITLVASGVDLLDFLQDSQAINLYNTQGLSDCYLQDGSFSKYKFFQTLKTSTSLINGEDILQITFDNDKVLVQKNVAFASSEATIHSIDFYMLGVRIATVYFNIPRDFTYTFDSTFVTMHADEELDLTMLASSLIDYNEDIVGENNITYTLVSTSASTDNLSSYVVIADDSTTGNQILSVPTGKQNLEQNVTLIASVPVNDNYLTAKASVHILPKYTLEATDNVLYLGEDPYNYLQTTESGVIKQFNSSEVVETNLKSVRAGDEYYIPVYTYDENTSTTIESDFANPDVLEFKEYTLNGNSVTIIEVNNTCTNQSVTESNAIFYAPANVQDNITASLDVVLNSYIGEFYYVKNNSGNISYIKHSSMSNIKFYAIDYDGGLKLNYCQDNILQTKISAQEYKQQILIEADVAFVDSQSFSAKCYGVITLTIYPSLQLKVL